MTSVREWPPCLFHSKYCTSRTLGWGNRDPRRSKGKGQPSIPSYIRNIDNDWDLRIMKTKPIFPRNWRSCPTSNWRGYLNQWEWKFLHVEWMKSNFLNNRMIYEFGAPTIVMKGTLLIDIPSSREEDILSWSNPKGPGLVLPLEESQGKELIFAEWDR